MPDWSVYLGAGASAIAILGGIYAAFRHGRAVTRALRRRLTRFKPTVPRETIRAVPLRDCLARSGKVVNVHLLQSEPGQCPQDHRSYGTHSRNRR